MSGSYAPGGQLSSGNSPTAASKEKWSPELLAACATIAIAVLAQWRTEIRFFPSGAAIGVAAAVTVVIAALLNRWLHDLAPVSQFVITLIVTLSVVLGLGFGLYWHATSPGRAARAGAANWTAIKVLAEPAGKRLKAAKAKYGTGYGYQVKGLTYIHMDSNMSNMISWLPSKPTSATYYAQITARQISGSDSTACVLSFAWKNTNSFFEMSLRKGGLQLDYWDGKLPARVYEGPVGVPYATNLSDWHTIAVLVRSSEVTAFVDDSKVFAEYIPQSLTGGVDFGTMDIGSGYTDDATCEFKSPEIRSLAG